MRIAEVLLEDFDSEISNTRRTLERVPEQPEYRPHEKSMPMGRLAMHCASLPLFGVYIIEDGEMDIAAPRRPRADLNWASLEACLTQLDANAAQCRERLVQASDEHLQALWKFSLGEHLISHATRSRTFLSLFFDHMIHHTSQLGVYLRLLGVPVPALYGPSADEPWSPK